MTSEKKIIVHVSAFLKNKNGEYLFLKRSEDSSWAPSIFDLPGGKMEWGEHPLDTLGRELLEEIGTVASNITFAGMQTRITELKNVKYHVLKLYYFGTISTDVKLNDEHQSFKWFTIKEALEANDIVDGIKKFIEKGQQQW